ncbi:MAG TPA: hypothetical protein VHE35_30825 [Kofleriaceae bacterium]|nr:hypothetical protein [Kofleriaceae bacterium]
MKLTLLASIFASGLALAACGGKSSAKEPAPPAQPTPLAPGAWEGMSQHDRADFMKHTVLPVMAEKFKAFDSQKFADVSCETCHGPGAKEGKFDMPSGALPELDFSAPPDPSKAAIGEFMMKEVKPTMANLLGMKEYEPDNPTGFGCLQCHTMKKSE